MERKHKRHRKFIKSSEQLLIATEIILHSLFFLALIALFLFAPPFVTLGSQYTLVEHQAIAKELVLLNAGKWYLFLLVIIFLGLVSILFSHQIVGPTYHFEMVLKMLKDKKLYRRAQIRKWDYFRDTQRELNAHIESLQQDIGDLKGTLEELKKKMNTDLADKQSSLGPVVERLERVLGHYELEESKEGSDENINQPTET